MTIDPDDPRLRIDLDGSPADDEHYARLRDALDAHWSTWPRT